VPCCSSDTTEQALWCLLLLLLGWLLLLCRVRLRRSGGRRRRRRAPGQQQRRRRSAWRSLQVCGLGWEEWQGGEEVTSCSSACTAVRVCGMLAVQPHDECAVVGTSVAGLDISEMMLHGCGGLDIATPGSGTVRLSCLKHGTQQAP